MSINQQQFEHLTEIGISLWQRRAVDNSTIEEPTSKADPVNFEHIDLNTLANHQLFTDILLSTGLSIGEIHQQDDHLDLGLFNWYFQETKDDKTHAEIRWSGQQLITPPINQLAKSPTLKKQLWQILVSKI